MARPQKGGLDYFSVDCHFSDSVKLIQAEFGLVGIGILIRLWQKIYGEKGYYTKWDTDVALVFSSECNVGANVVNEVVSACIRRGLFDKNKYDRFGILTSASIQEHFAGATSRRESQEVFADYLLIPARKNWVFAYNNPVYVDNNSKNDDDNPQSKVKESKVKYSKEYVSPQTPQGGDEKKPRTRFVKPTVEEIRSYCQERNNGIDPERFFDFYESKGWVVGKQPMKDWKACIRTWEKSANNSQKQSEETSNPFLAMLHDMEKQETAETPLYADFTEVSG